MVVSSSAFILSRCFSCCIPSESKENTRQKRDMFVQTSMYIHKTCLKVKKSIKRRELHFNDNKEARNYVYSIISPHIMLHDPKIKKEMKHLLYHYFP